MLEHTHGATLGALEKAQYVRKTIGYEGRINTTYKELEQLKYELEKNDIKIISTKYSENIELLLEIPEKKVEEMENLKIKTEKSTKKYVEI